MPFFWAAAPQAVEAVPEGQPVAVQAAVAPCVTGFRQINPTTVEVLLQDQRQLTFDFYGEQIVRLFQDNAGGILRDPKADPEAHILVKNPRRSLQPLACQETTDQIVLATQQMRIAIDKASGCLHVTDLRNGRTVLESLAPVSFVKGKTQLQLKEQPTEYFYGGGVQNGRFSHKGKVIQIVNQNSWTDGGVASPTPFYWSTAGYGLLFHTFAKGAYDFGATEPGVVRLSHDSDYLDLFLMVDETPVGLLNDFYQLTGNPVLLPKFGFYQGHLNAYNRDYWKEDEKGILFEDGKRYKESQKENGGIKESLNGEKNNYQFSARAVVDRYRDHDMPLGWVLPNDGYGAGYGQTETLDGNVANLKSFGDYARQQGVEIGLWTQSDLHPKEGVSALLQRDIVKEVRDAGVRVLKTDVAWVGAGYSFGLNGVADVGEIMPYYGNNARPFIISLDGWAGTQRYAGIWSGDQTGGEWEYIRFHIPTYIGSGLSGQPNISSDMDGIFGGQNAIVNTRDFQWKTWSIMQLNMDGWGRNEKYPHALGEPATSINRHYLKLKSELLPYAYTYAKEALDGKPLIRAMFLDDPNDFTHGTHTRYQYLFGPDFLVAPIYQATQSDAEGNDIRDCIYLPEGEWIDYFNGDLYTGGRVINNFAAPLWKLPVFVRQGAIIPMVNPNNQPGQIDPHMRIVEFYPKGHSEMTVYDDDGRTEAYRLGAGTQTRIESDWQADQLTVTFHPTVGQFDGFEPEQTTEMRIQTTQRPKRVTATVGGKSIKLNEVSSLEAFQQGTNCFFYEARPNRNRFATKGSSFEQVEIVANPQLRVKVAACDVTREAVSVAVKGFAFHPTDKTRQLTGALAVPQAQIQPEDREAYTLRPTWQPVAHADYYEIELNGMLYSTIRNTHLLFDNLQAETDYRFRIRAVNREGVSDWSEFSARTKNNPLEFAIRNLKGEVTAPSQEGFEVFRLFDWAESGDTWHTEYGKVAVPFDLTVDLRSVNTLDKFHYLGRLDGGNGLLLKGTVSYSLDKEHWSEPVPFEWQRNSDVKVFEFADKPTARYIRLSVSEAVGKYGSGRELYVFKVPGTESFLPGDINSDGKIDQNDWTSYTNYTGLRQGDADFEGYVSVGDLNRNGLIDAYDISVVGTQLEDGTDPTREVAPVAGEVKIAYDKTAYQAGETVTLTVKGSELKSVNALSCSIAYDERQLEYVGIEPQQMQQLENLTNDRLHTNGTKSLYPTFVNVGEKPSVEGNVDLFVVRFKAKQRISKLPEVRDFILVDKNLNVNKIY